MHWFNSLVGRSPEFEALQQQFALQVVLRATLMSFFPKFAHP
jgi:hypothetical protein